MSPEPEAGAGAATATAAPRLADLQRRMARAVLTGDPAAAAATAAAIVPAGIPAPVRLEIHRANVAISLVKALEAAFPVTVRLAGTRRFRTAARAFVERHPPARPQLSAYGGGFAEFLDGFEPARAVPVLADMARLEWARVEALFAADAAPLAAAALAGVPQAAMPGIVFRPHPSLRLVASRFPVQATWAAHQAPEPPDPDPDPAGGGETVLLLRPGPAVVAEVVTPADNAFLAAVADGRTLAEAAGAAAALDPAHDLQRALLAHLTRGSFAGFRLAEGPAGHPA